MRHPYMCQVDDQLDIEIKVFFGFSRGNVAIAWKETSVDVPRILHQLAESIVLLLQHELEQ